MLEIRIIRKSLDTIRNWLFSSKLGVKSLGKKSYIQVKSLSRREGLGQWLKVLLSVRQGLKATYTPKFEFRRDTLNP